MEVLWPMDSAVDAVKGSRDRSSCRAVAVASTPGSRAQAPTEGGFLGLCHKSKLADGG